MQHYFSPPPSFPHFPVFSAPHACNKKLCQRPSKRSHRVYHDKPKLSSSFCSSHSAFPQFFTYHLALFPPALFFLQAPWANFLWVATPTAKLETFGTCISSLGPLRFLFISSSRRITSAFPGSICSLMKLVSKCDIDLQQSKGTAECRDYLKHNFTALGCTGKTIDL